MLLELSIENFVTIRKLNLSFEAGLTVLTGETGAGKSILLHAMQTLLGRRLNQELIGAHQDFVRVSGLFACQELESAWPDYLDQFPKNGEVLLTREVSRSGRGRAFVNGQLVTVGQLSDFGARLINICGQHQSVRILDQSYYLDFVVDDFCELVRERADFEEFYGAVQKKREQVKQMKEAASKAALRSAELQHLVSDLKKVCETTLERADIEDALRRYRTAEDFAARREEIFEVVESDSGVLENLKQIRTVLAQCCKLDPKSGQYAQLLSRWDEFAGQFEGSLQSLLGDLNRELGGRVVDEVELEDLRALLSLIASLERKYRRDHSGLRELFSKAQEELGSLQSIDDDLPRNEKDLLQQEQKLRRLAEGLSAKRKDGALRLQSLVEKELRELSISDAVFKVNFETVDCGPRGIDRVDFLISTNKGMEPRPLAAVASGGELSRITLALKKILSDRSGVNVLVFDEVDTGISGRVARVVGEKLRQLAQNGSQVLCVTHLPQIASLADHHFEVLKTSAEDGGVQTIIKKLEGQEKVNEIAKMLAGLEVTQASLATASELLASKQ